MMTHDSSKTQSYVASNEDDSDEFDTSDNEPLSKKVSKRSDSPEFEQEGSDSRSLANEEDHVVKLKSKDSRISIYGQSSSTTCSP